METRHWKKQNLDISLLGFGCMRFPLTEQGTIDEEEAAKMLEAARAAGVNYYDTANPYHNGESEPFLGRFLQRWERSSYNLATKLPIWKCGSLEEAKAIFASQLERLQTDYIDFYLLHAMDQERYDHVLKLGILDWCYELKAQGKIKNLGFSFHDSYEVFEKMLTSHEWDFCQIQYNYMDREHQAGDKGYALAEKMGIPLVIMEPIRGGGLAKYPDALEAPLKALRPNASTASWALRWVGTHPGVNVILSGMSTMEQALDNLSTFTNFEPLNDEEQAAILNLEKELRSRRHNTCTGCEYCLPCPRGVNIPRNFTAWNNSGIYGASEPVLSQWKNMDASEKAQQCIGCGACEKVCPQQINIRDNLKTLQAELDKMCAEA